PADGKDRMESAEGVLRDEADPAAAQLPQPAVVERDQVGIGLEARASRGPRAGMAQQAEEGVYGDGFSRPALADEADDLVFADIEGDVANRAQRPGGGRQHRRQVLDAQDHRPVLSKRTSSCSATTF